MTLTKTLKKTPLYSCHQQLGARLVPFAGYEMPVQYTGVLDETKATRASLGLFDVSHMGQFSVRGKAPLAAVQALVTNDLSRLKIGQAQYNMLCNEQGFVIDDLIVYHRSEGETYICVNAGNRAVDFDWMKARLSPSVTLTDQSDETALIAVQGPKAESLISRLCDGAWVSALKYYWAIDTKIAGVDCYLSRTGYTGEDGFEIYLHAEKATAIWNRLLEEGKKEAITPCGLGARDTLRLEMGYPLHGHELSTEISPLEVGLGWVVKPNLPTAFVGQAALRAQKEKGLTRALTGFTVLDKRIARQGYEIVDPNGRRVGEITSGTFSPHLNAPIALGFVATDCQHDPLFAKIRGEAVPLKKTALPFVASHTKKG